MTLLDIGNTTAGLWQDGQTRRILLKDFSWQDFGECYFICVNDALLPQAPASAINLQPHFELNSNYRGLGVDRAAGCYFWQDGIIVDAGSAITVDAMRAGVHEGGFILPGVQAFKRAYSLISSRLDVSLNETIDLNLLPNCTQDAISYGLLSAVVSSISQFAQGRSICLTGGDSAMLQPYFPAAIMQENLVFKGMLKLINDKNL